MNGRKTIKSITVTYDDGTSKPFPVPGQLSALFVDWDMIEKILIPFYEGDPTHFMTRDETALDFGENIANTIFGTDPNPAPKLIDRKFIGTVWNTEVMIGSGLFVSEIPKRPSCMI